MADEEPPQNNPELYRKWMREISNAQKREKKFREQAKSCVDLYEAREECKAPFAILYSNTETIAPAVYNSTPIPVVARRFKDPDPIGKEAAEVSTRTLKYLIDTDAVDEDSFDDVLQAAVTDALVTNRGLAEVKFAAEISEEDVRNQGIFLDSRRWDKFCHGHARTWKKVPWISLEDDMTKEEIQQNFPNIPVSRLNFDSLPEPGQDGVKTTGETKQELTGVKVVQVYKVWNKADRKVYFFSPCYPDGPLKVVDDPLKLSGFFPMPRPLNFFKKSSTLVPTPLYEQYRQQAQELNDITVRLKFLIRALKVRGYYNSTISGIERLIEAEDNTLIPIENVEAIVDSSGQDKMVWLMPLADIATTIQNLYVQREQVKQVIYEITGVSDIIRGASVASESATAQNLKNQWGTLRLKKMQKEVQRYCRDLLAIMLEIAGKNFDIETFKQMTGLQYPTDQEKVQAQIQLQQAEMQAALNGTEPPPPDPQIMQVIQTPSWEDVTNLLANDVLRSYRVDIETNSTIDAEAAQDKQDIAELMNAIAQLLNGIGPLVQEGVLPMEIAKSLLLVIARRYTFGSQIEDAINMMQAPQPQSDPAADAKAQAEQARMQADMQKMQVEQETLQMEARIKREEMQAEAQLKQLDIQIKQEELLIKRAELQIKREELQIKAEASRINSQSKLEQAQIRAMEAKAKSKEPANASV